MPSRSEFLRRVSDMPVTGEDDPHLTRWLQPEKVLFGADANDTAGLFDIAAQEIARIHAVDPAHVLRALTRREQAESTALGHRFAIPHARIAGIGEPVTLLIRLSEGIEFQAPDRAICFSSSWFRSGITTPTFNCWPPWRSCSPTRHSDRNWTRPLTPRPWRGS
jgi:hypothetical protein